MPLPNYQPPQFRTATGPLNERVREFSEYWDKFFNYERNFLNKLIAGDIAPVVAVAAAATIAPEHVIQPVSGTAAIDTIAVSVTVVGPKLTLLAMNGFSFVTGGNIAAAKTLLAGEAASLYYNILDALWYPETGLGGGAIIVPTAPYSVSNVSTDRSYDAALTTVNELANVLGTLIQDLQAAGIVG